MQGSCRRVALTGLSKTFDGPPTDGPFYKRQLIDKLTKQQQLRRGHYVNMSHTAHWEKCRESFVIFSKIFLIFSKKTKKKIEKNVISRKILLFLEKDKIFSYISCSQCQSTVPATQITAF